MKRMRAECQGRFEPPLAAAFCDGACADSEGKGRDCSRQGGVLNP